MKPYLIIISLLFLASCGELEQAPRNGTDEQSAKRGTVKRDIIPYTIAYTEKHETPGEAQIMAYAYVGQLKMKGDDVEATLLHIYDSLKSYDQFNEHSSPTTIGVFLHIGKKSAEEKHSWLGMLQKTAGMAEPSVMLDEGNIETANQIDDFGRTARP